MAGKTFEECMEEACRMGIAASQAATPEEAAALLAKMAQWLELAKLGFPRGTTKAADGMDREAEERRNRRAG
jgi:phage-related tail protein